jgi:hypothetical protein
MEVSASSETELFAAFVDAIGRPIADLKLKFDTGDNILELTTDQDGTLPVIDFGGEKAKGAAIVVLPNGKEEVVLKFELSLGTNCYLCESPYVVHTAKVLRHEGTPTPPAKNEIKPAGTENIVRSQAGNPVVQITTQDCPNSDNLKLYPNQQYKRFILNAAKHGDLIPQGVAALINTEAGKIIREIEKPVLDKKGKPVLDKDGKPKTKTMKMATKEWEPTSTNPRSSARGLTQFLDGTWIGLATSKDSYLSEQAIRRGYVAEEVKTNRLIVKNKKGLLSMRDDPETSIMVSVDYGVLNFRALLRKKCNVSGINSSEKAKLFYLMHHLGFGEAWQFIENKIQEERAKKIFSDQIGKDAVEARAKKEEGNSYVLAHRRWLIGFIDSNIVPRNFACDISRIAEARSLFDLITAIGGAHPNKFIV